MIGLSCGQAAELLSDHADGELGRMARWRLERHLAVCARCRSVYRTLVVTIETVRTLAAREPPPNPELAATVLRRIETDA